MPYLKVETASSSVVQVIFSATELTEVTVTFDIAGGALSAGGRTSPMANAGEIWKNNDDNPKKKANPFDVFFETTILFVKL